MNGNIKMGPISNEQKKVIEKLEEVLLFLKSTPVKNDGALVFIKKPINDLQSSLKYLPTEPLFKIFPAEIKRKILNYLCDSNAFTAASVCLEWKEILESRFEGKAVTLGKRCCTEQCKDNMCLKPSQMLKALATHKIDVALSVYQPVKKVDSKIVTNALTSVSKFSINGGKNCTCENENEEDSDISERECDCDLNPLSNNQFEDLFKGLEIREEVVEKVELMALDLTELNQDRLVHCFLNKIKNLTLSPFFPNGGNGVIFDVEAFFRKLSEESTEQKLTHLTLGNMIYPNGLTDDLANALCNVEYVDLNVTYLESESVKKIIQNILTCPVKIKTLIMSGIQDFRTLINTVNLTRLLKKMTKIQLRGFFTSEQLQTAESLLDVKVSRIIFNTIQKGF